MGARAEKKPPSPPSPGGGRSKFRSLALEQRRHLALGLDVGGHAAGGGLCACVPYGRRFRGRSPRRVGEEKRARVSRGRGGLPPGGGGAPSARPHPHPRRPP